MQKEHFLVRMNELTLEILWNCLENVILYGISTFFMHHILNSALTPLFVYKNVRTPHTNTNLGRRKQCPGFPDIWFGTAEQTFVYHVVLCLVLK